MNDVLRVLEIYLQHIKFYRLLNYFFTEAIFSWARDPKHWTSNIAIDDRCKNGDKLKIIESFSICNICILLKKLFIWDLIRNTFLSFWKMNMLYDRYDGFSYVVNIACRMTTRPIRLFPLGS